MVHNSLGPSDFAVRVLDDRLELKEERAKSARWRWRAKALIDDGSICNTLDLIHSHLAIREKS